MWRQPPQMSADDYMEKMAERRMEVDGSEIPDPVPLEPPVGYVKKPSMFETMREMVKREMAMRMQNDADGGDGDVDDDDYEEEDDFPRSHREYSEEDDVWVRQTAAELAERRKSASESREAPPASPAAPPQPPAEPAES